MVKKDRESEESSREKKQKIVRGEKGSDGGLLMKNGG